MDAENIVRVARKAFDSGKTRTYDFRKRQLNALLRMYEENIEEMVDVLKADLNKPRSESIVTEIDIAINDVKFILNNLKSWMKPEKGEKALAHSFTDVGIIKEPYGLVLIIGSWNYPVHLTFVPVASAIAAGNTVIIKPSEVSVATTKFMVNTFSKYLDQECYYVYPGDIPQTQKLLNEKFDYIFFTGSTYVGKIVHQAASKHLTPTTLELGGKSPLYLDNVKNMENAVKRIVWGKLLCCGQTCIAPDYILCSKEVQEKFIKIAKQVVEEMYGPNLKDSPDYCRIISSKHFDRLKRFLDEGKIALGGAFDPIDKYIQFTILVDVKPTDAVMQVEIFGPILPIINVTSPAEAVEFIKSRDKPLALYVFSDHKKVTDFIIDKTSSGGVCVNDTVMHITTKMPFGGVGDSGMGSYHGKYGFETFSHKRSYLKSNLSSPMEKILSFRYAPYDDLKLNVMRAIARERTSFSSCFTIIPYFLVYLLGILSAVLFYKFY